MLLETEEEFELMEEIAEEPQEPVQKEHSKNEQTTVSNQTKRTQSSSLTLNARALSTRISRALFLVSPNFASSCEESSMKPPVHDPPR